MQGAGIIYGIYVHKISNFLSVPYQLIVPSELVNRECNQKHWRSFGILACILADFVRRGNNVEPSIM